MKTIQVHYSRSHVFTMHGSKSMGLFCNEGKEQGKVAHIMNAHFVTVENGSCGLRFI